MNRIVITLSKNGEIDSIASDLPVEVLFHDPNCKNEPVYHYRAVNVGPDKVRSIIGDSPVYYGGDEILVDANPSKPHIEVVKCPNT